MKTTYAKQYFDFFDAAALAPRYTTYASSKFQLHIKLKLIENECMIVAKFLIRACDAIPCEKYTVCSTLLRCHAAPRIIEELHQLPR